MEPDEIRLEALKLAISLEEVLIEDSMNDPRPILLQPILDRAAWFTSYIKGNLD